MFSITVPGRLKTPGHLIIPQASGLRLWLIIKTTQDDSSIKVQEDAVDQQVANTNFATDSTSKVATPSDAIFVDSPMVGTRDYSTLTLNELLCTPIAVAEGNLTSANPIQISLQSHSTILTKSAFMLSKLKGFLGIRATVVCRLVVNADKYTQGRLAVSYKIQQTENAVERLDHRHVTQLPHVTLDLNTETEVSLKIPHRGPFTHFDIAEGRYNTGVFQVTQLLPHRGNPYSFTIYMNYEDIDLIGPTHNTTVQYQSGLAVEQKNTLLSEKVMKLSSVVSSFGNVPLLTSYVQPLAWAMGVASKVMSAFGFSKPTANKSPDIFHHRDRPGYNTTDGVDTAEPLAMTLTSSVKVDPYLGLTAVDEMSIKYLTGINSVVVRNVWNSSAVSGTLLYRWNLCPWGMKSNYNLPQNALTDAMIPHPIAFLSDLFEKYRGSMTFTIDFSKTIFHSGRILVVFVPSTSNLRRIDLVPDKLADSSTFTTFLESTRNCHKDIIDLRKGNKFVLNFPYVALTPYTNVEHGYGIVHMYVLNQLVASDASVPPQIDYSISVKAGEDFEFAVPAVPRYFPYEKVGNSPVEPLYPKKTTQMATYQSGLETTNNTIIDKCVGGSVPSKESIVYAEHCIGEKILSVKQIAMRSKVFFTINDTPAELPWSPFYVDTFMDASMRSLQVWSNTVTTPYTGIVRPCAHMYDFYSYIGNMYAYVRGGVVITIEAQAGVATYFGLINDHYRNKGKSYGEWNLVLKTSDSQAQRAYIPPNSNSSTRYTVRTPLIPVPTADSKGDYTTSYGYSCPTMNVTNLSGDPVSATLSRCAADDTQFGGFRGCPFIALRRPYSTVAEDPIDFTFDRKLDNAAGFFPQS